MRLLSLFAGGGLGDFGFMASGMDIAGQIEIDEYCQKILTLRYPDSYKWRDIKNVTGEEIKNKIGQVDIITGGFPCQPFSVAGKQKGKEDNRYLWPEMLRIITECRPRWIVGENVPGIINLALDTVCTDLEAEGYEVWPIVFPSHALGAWHKRDRLWIICHSKHDGQLASQESRSVEARSGSGETEQEQASKPARPSEQYAPVAYSTDTGLEGMCGRQESAHEDVSNTRPFSKGSKIIRGNGEGSSTQFFRCSEMFRRYWKSEPAVGRVANGIADRVHRLKMLGNGQVPAATYVIGKMIMEIEDQLKEVNK